MYVVSYVIAKAFHSVNHLIIIRAIRALGTPGPLCGYPSSNIDRLCTNVFDRSNRITRGLKHGDPVSPLGFNAVMEDATSVLDQGIGYDIDGFNLTNCL